MPIPQLESFDKYIPKLAQMVAEFSWLPNAETVRSWDRAVFPTKRANRLYARFTPIIESGEEVGMYDDNTTPTWAMLWSHGMVGGGRKGWAFAHVWQASDDMSSYTCLANLAMIPECFASLTDKDGPLTSYLRWHAWVKYDWKPDHVEPPHMPPDYDQVQWRYLEHHSKSKQFINDRLVKQNNQRTKILHRIMKRNCMV